jgi:hypothetical protein
VMYFSLQTSLASARALTMEIPSVSDSLDFFSRCASGVRRILSKTACVSLSMSRSVTSQRFAIKVGLRPSNQLRIQTDKRVQEMTHHPASI